MEVKINLTLLSDSALKDIGAKISVCAVRDVPWLMAIKLRGGKTLALYPISTINPLAPPSFYMTDERCKEGVGNKETVEKIMNEMRKYTKSKSLRPAILLLKKAINIISKH